MTSDPLDGWTRSAVVLARLLDIDRTTVFSWRRAGMPWSDDRGFPIAECQQWAQDRRAAQEARRAAGDDRALVELRRGRARLAWHRVDRRRADLVPTTWAAEQIENRKHYLGDLLLRVVPELAAGVADAHPRAACLAIEGALRRVVDTIAAQEAEVGLPTAERVSPLLEEEPAVRPGETASAAARRWLGECHRAEAAGVELALAIERGEFVSLDWMDGQLADRAMAARRALQGLGRGLAVELVRMTEAEAAARLRAELEAVVAHFGRPLPPPPASTPDLADDPTELHHDDLRTEGTITDLET